MTGRTAVPSSDRPRLGPVTATALVIALAILAAGPARAADKEAARDTDAAVPAGPFAATALHRLGAGARALLLSGETDARDYPVVLTADEARAHARLHLAYTNAVSVMAEASRMRVLVNDILVSETAIASPTVEHPGVLDIDLPASLLEPGANAVRIEVQERHRVDCSVGATYELWTQVDPATAGFTFASLKRSSIADLADLPALDPDEDGTVPLRLVVPNDVEAQGLDRLFRTVEATALRGRFGHPVVDVESAPSARPGLDLVAGTVEALTAAGFADLVPAESGGVALRAGSVPGQSVLVVSGRTPAEVDAAIASLLPSQGDQPYGTPAGVRVASRAGGVPLEGGSVVALRDLGVASQEFSGRLFRTGFDILLPPDFYAADYGKMTIRVDAGYAAGLLRGSQILVAVNGRDAASLPLGNPYGDIFRGRPIAVPLTHLRPGLNHIQIEAQLPSGTDAACEAAATLAAKKRFVLLDSTTVEMPSIARIARLPALSATAVSGFPYVASRGGGSLYLPHPDADSVSAAATFLARSALSAGVPLGARVSLGRADALRGSVLAFGAFADLPPAMIAEGGLDPAAMRDAWSHVAARSAAEARLRDARTVAGQPTAALDAIGDDRDGSSLFRRWSDDVSASHWRFEPMRLAADALRRVAGLGADNLPRWSASEDRFAVSPDMRLVVAQHEAAGGDRDTLTLVVAPTGETLRRAMRDLTDLGLWDQLDGRVAVLDAHQAKIEIVQPRADYFIPTATLSPGNLRLIAAGWLSSEIDVFVLGFVLLALGLGAATARTLKYYGVKP